MHPFDDNYWSKMSPEFEKQPRTEAPAPPPPPAAKPAKAAAEPETAKLFDSIASYISQHQRHITSATPKGTTKKAFKMPFLTAIN